MEVLETESYLIPPFSLVRAKPGAFVGCFYLISGTESTNEIPHSFLLASLLVTLAFTIDES